MQQQDLEARRAEVENKLAAMKMDPVAAKLVREADAVVAAYRAKADEYEAQIADIDAQLGVRERDRRAAAEQEKQERRSAACRQIEDEHEAHLQAVADAEAAARALLEAMERAFATNAQRAKSAQGLTPGGKVPSIFSALDLASRFGGRLAGLMATLKGHRARLGGIEWIGGSLFPPAHNWRADEERRMAATMETLVGKGKS